MSNDEYQQGQFWDKKESLTNTHIHPILWAPNSEGGYVVEFYYDGGKTSEVIKLNKSKQ